MNNTAYDFPIASSPETGSGGCHYPLIKKRISPAGLKISEVR